MIETPEWRDVPGFEGLYKVSSGGVVESTRRSGTRGGPLKPSLNKRGYHVVALCRGGKPVWYEIQRVVAAAFLGARPAGFHTRHLNGNSLDNRIANITYGTVSENQYDTVRHGRHKNARKTHCPQGHAYDEGNTRRYRGYRYCRACGH